jgi:2-oxoacid:acceptor oxidoreductase delta subunit (pyruvate/2-ketoisovalerate family)
MKNQAKKPFDAASIPDNLCPIAVKRVQIKTGDWRAMRPVVDPEKCVKCATCWAYCPTQCILEKKNYFDANLWICKGCGICARECPQNAITMVEEQEV